MSTKLFKNTEGKVLMSVGNKLIKQPYEFGNAFQNRMGLNNYIKVSGLSVNPTDMTILGWYNLVATNYQIQSLETESDSISLYSYGSNRLMSLTKNGKLSSNINLISTSDNGVTSGMQLIASGISPTSGFIGVNRYVPATSFNGSYIPQAQITTSLIGAYSVSKIINSVLTQPFNRQILFSRQLSQQEFYYYYNNRIGNDIQLHIGVVYDIYCDKAEVINISGVDQPCVRDYSGNNYHGIIMNLPAGTAQQKVDFANANLFVPFQ